MLRQSGIEIPVKELIKILCRKDMGQDEPILWEIMLRVDRENPPGGD